MVRPDDYFEQALRLGQKELALLEDEKVEEAEELARQRGELIEDFCAQKQHFSEAEFLDKLKQLQRLQGQIGAAALGLRAVLQKEIVRIREENRRLKGYRKVAKVTPISSRYVSKKG
jgi:hypothetical protein